ncbi:MAG: hypothetical protein ACI9HK_001812 [Pirellulaceae bacterium]|jgi:hypothetical protein
MIRSSNDSRVHNTVSRIALLSVLSLAFVSGCAKARLDDTYGRSQGDGSSSVNATSIFAQMFAQQGYRVRSARSLSPGINRADTIVWAPDSYVPPRENVMAFLERWLKQDTNRTLIYIGRDYDAEVEYWDAVANNVPVEQLSEFNRRRAIAKAEYLTGRLQIPKDHVSKWFKIQGQSASRNVTTLAGEWASDIDPQKLEFKIRARFTPPTDVEMTTPTDVEKQVWTFAREEEIEFNKTEHLDSEVLLESEGDPLVYRLDVHGVRVNNPNQIIVVPNGSFVLNLPLVNHERRKLANKLIAACKSKNGEVVFLQSQGDGPPIRSGISDKSVPPGLEMFTVWPLSVIMLHLFTLGIIFIFSRSPIFGVPRELDSESLSDFGKHIDALGESLERTGRADYAQQRLAYYRTHVRRDSGASHREPRKK